MTTQLRTLLISAMEQVASFKEPAGGEFCIEINKVLHAIQQGEIIDIDEVTEISEYNGFLSIHVQWPHRGCKHGVTYRFPSYVIDAADPIHSAKRWSLEQEIITLESNCRRLRAELGHALTNLDNLQQQLLATPA